MTDTPATNPRVGPAEKALVATSRAAAAAREGAHSSIGHWLKTPAVLAVALAFFSYNYVLYFFLTWLPTYLTSVHHLDITSMSLLTVIPWVCGSIGMLGGGLLSDALFKRTGNSVLSRKIVLVGGLLLAALSVIVASQATTVGIAVTLIACANLFLLMAPQNCWVLIQEIVPSSQVGGVGGFVHLLANTAGIIGPALTGFIVQYGGGYGASFLLSGALAIAGAMAVLLVVRSKGPPALGAVA